MYTKWSFQGGSAVKNLPANTGEAGDGGLTLWLERSPGRGNGNPIYYSFLETLMDRGAWWGGGGVAIVQGSQELDTT